MKTYLNKQEREDLIVLNGAMGHLKERFEQVWSKGKSITPEELKYVRTANTYMDKVMRSMIARLDKDFIQKLIRDVKGTEFSIVTKEKAEIRRQQQAKLEAGFEILGKRDDLFDILEIALQFCNDCTRTDYTDCKLREAAHNMDIPPADLEAENKCQYKL